MKMKKTTFLSILISILPLTTFALSPLNETFESFSISVPAAGTGWNVVSTTDPSLKWEYIGAQVNVVANPNKTGINTSDKVLQLSRPATVIATDAIAQGYHYKGTFTTTYALPTIANSCIIEMKILKTIAGMVGVRVVPDATNTNIYTIVTKTIPGSPDWQTVQFDFTSIASTITATPRLNFEMEKTGTVVAQQDALVVYVDDIKIVGLTTEINQVNEVGNLDSYIDSANSLLKFKNLPIGQYNVSIKNLSGIECENLNIHSTDDKIDVSALSTGVYIVSCKSTSTKMLIGKVIKR